MGVGFLVLLCCACLGSARLVPEGARGPADPAAERARMVAGQIEARGVRDPLVLEAMRRVERHRFVPPELAAEAHDDNPLAIGEGQTLSQPYVVAFMTEALELRGGERVLEIGTGSGYQAAVLACIAAEVLTIEIRPALAAAAAERLERLGHVNVQVRAGDGSRGWPERAPFDAILLAAAPERLPPALHEQLAPGGRLVAPVGGEVQELVRVRRGPRGLEQERLLAVRFVPMTGEAGRAGDGPGDRRRAGDAPAGR